MVAYTGPSQSQGGVIAGPEAIAYTPEIWLPQVIRYRNRAFSLASYVTPISFGGKKGDTIRQPYIGRLRARQKTAGNPFQFETRSEGEFKMVVDRHTYAAFSVDKKMDMQAEIDIAAEYSPEIGQALTEDIEYALLAERATFRSYDPTNNSHSSSSPIDITDIMIGIEVMLKRHFDLTELYLHIGPSQFISLFSVDEFIQSGVYNSGDIANIKSGSIVGTIMGVKVVLNQNIRANSTTGLVLGGNDYDDTTNGEVVATPGMSTSPFLPTQYGSDKYPITLDDFLVAGYHTAMLMHPKAIGLAMAMAPTLEMWWEPNYGETRYRSDQIYDIKVVDPTAAFLINTDEDSLVG